MSWSPGSISMSDVIDQFDQYLARLFPLNRSLTGAANRETLQILSELVPLNCFEYSSGKVVYDWIVPQEWEIRAGWIKDSQGEIIVDYADSHLHVATYSEPVDLFLTAEQLKPHLFVHPKLVDALPYRTLYYDNNWAFCLTHDQLSRITNEVGNLHVYIDSRKFHGSMTVGEFLIPGKYDQEILISTYLCHPSMANDNLSGIVLTAFLAREILKNNNLLHSYRFVWAPETIGAIAYCQKNREYLQKIKLGLNISTVGGPGPFSLKQSFNSDHSVNAIIEGVLQRKFGDDYIIYPFDVTGSDERQYSSQGFGINMAAVCKDKYYEYPEYHSSADDLSLVNGENLKASFDVYLDVIKELDKNLKYVNLKPFCEPHMRKYNLYQTIGGANLPINSEEMTDQTLCLWLLHLADGTIDLHGVAKKIKQDFFRLSEVAELLTERGLLGTQIPGN